MSVIIRGGTPIIHRQTGIDVTGVEIPFRGRQPSLWWWIKNFGVGNNLKLFVTQKDFDADSDFITLSPNEVVEGMFESTSVWIMAAAGTVDVEMLIGLRFV